MWLRHFKPLFSYPTILWVVALSLWTATPALADMRLEGTMKQGGLVLGATQPGSRVFFNDAEIRVSPEGYFLIGFHRNEPSPVYVEARLPGGSIVRRELIVEQRTYHEQRIDGLPPSKVSPSPDDLQRIRAETQMIKKAHRRDTDQDWFTKGFIWPTRGRISGIYGSRRILNGQPRRPHFGIDIAVPTGTPVHSPAAGVVALVHNDMFFSGGTLIIDHGHGLSSTMIHLHKILVEPGAFVSQGQPIAEVGATGRATGPHLDWRMNLFNRRLDPELVAGPMPAP